MIGLLEAWRDMPMYRRRQLVLFVLALIFIGAVLWTVRAVLAPYAFGLGLAYLLAPLVEGIEQGICWLSERRGLGFLRRPARLIGIVVTYLVAIALLVGFFALVVPIMIQQGKALWAERETIWSYLSGLADQAVEQYRLLPTQVQVQIDETLRRFSEFVGTVVQQAVEGTAVVISYTFSLVLAIFIIPFWTFYLLLDSRKLGKALVTSIPAPMREDVRRVAELVDNAFSSYLRGQLFLGLIIGVTSTVALSLLGVRFAVVLGLIAGIFEMIPNIGPTLGAIPAVLVALVQEPVLALWTAIYAFAVQQVENLFVSPRVLGRSVQLHPVIVMVVLVIGSEIGGILGLFLAPVTTAVLRDLFRYVYYRVSEENMPPKAALQRVWQGQGLEL